MAGAMLATHEAGRVVVPHGLGVTEGLQHGIGLDHLIFQVALQPEVRQRSSRGEIEVTQRSSRGQTGHTDQI